MKEKPEISDQIEPILSNLTEQWDELEATTKTKAERLFDANRSVLYEQSCDDIDGWITQLESQVITEDSAKDLTTVNLLMQKQHVSALGTIECIYVGQKMGKDKKDIEYFLFLECDYVICNLN